MHTSGITSHRRRGRCPRPPRPESSPCLAMPRRMQRYEEEHRRASTAMSRPTIQHARLCLSDRPEATGGSMTKRSPCISAADASSSSTVAAGPTTRRSSGCPSGASLAGGDFVIWVFPNAGNPLAKVQRYAAEWATALHAGSSLRPAIDPRPRPRGIRRGSASPGWSGDGAAALEHLVHETLAPDE